jgi:hypothetical protein
MDVNANLTVKLVLSKKFLLRWLTYPPTTEFGKSEPTYLQVTNTKEVVLALFIWYIRNVPKVPDGFSIFIVPASCFLSAPLPS